MSKIAELHLEIEEMIEKGDHPATISAVLGCSVEFVYDVVESIHSETEELSPFSTVNS